MARWPPVSISQDGNHSFFTIGCLFEKTNARVCGCEAQVLELLQTLEWIGLEEGLKKGAPVVCRYHYCPILCAYKL